MRRAPILVTVTLVLMTAATQAAAQSAGAQNPSAGTDAAEQAVRGTIQRLFDGMRSRDTAAIRSTFAEQAYFYGVGQGGNLRVDTPSAFIGSIASAPANVLLDEVLHDIEVRIDGPVATVWTYYDFFAGDAFSHCGYNAFQLLNLQGEWRIVAVTDSRRREGCRQQRD